MGKLAQQLSGKSQVKVAPKGAAKQAPSKAIKDSCGCKKGKK